MAFCEKCGAQIPENGTFCAACGAPVAAQAQPTRIPEQPAAQPQAPEQQPQPPVYPQQPVYQQPVYPQQPAYDPADHTAEFDPEDVSQNKVIAMARTFSAPSASSSHCLRHRRANTRRSIPVRR